ncbi:ABC transporter permease subunit [Conexibacter arvalis]|uniref:Branched-chain amino acid transport system permease protein n=1 Tax=Conexibacter arvalis TaxID=912552 RepID=A0A840I9N6_9ACTN|nr:ATP-binding cassette domain-containing protein [Conexibacter arvalis]MBB4660640.1 branched-chain amino acid transport system permease protein [Conexibacter arvalis]
MTVRRVSLAAFAAVLLALPFAGSDRWLSIVVLALFAVLGAQALNVMVGLVGQVSIGNAAFLAIGGFTAALLDEQAETGFVLACAGALLAAGVVGAVASIPAFRLRGFYLAVSTIALTYAVLYVAAEVQNHEVGASGFRMPYPELLGVSLDSDVAWYWLLLPLAAIVTLLFHLVTRSSLGRAAQTVRDHEQIAPVFGVSTRWMKTAAFAISSGIIGLEGALMAYYVGTVHVENYTLLIAIEYLAMVVVGGLGSAIGVALGALLITALPFLLDDGLRAIGGTALSARTSDLTLIVTGAVIIGCLLWLPGGLISLPARVGAAIARIGRRGGKPTAEAPADVAVVREPAAVSRPAAAPATVSSAATAGSGGDDPLLQVTGLTVTYPNGVTAVRDVDLRCPKGSATLVVGANGAGKTTLLRALTGTLTSEKIATSAELDRYRGETLLRRSPDELTAAGIALVPERTKVFPGLTAAENLDVVPRRIAAGADRFVTRDDVLELLPRLAAVARTDAALLSGGEKQMLAIGRALLTQPRLLVIDELSLGLAPAIVRDLLEKVATIRGEFGVTVLMVEQAVRAALPVADRVVMLRHGAVVADLAADQWTDASEAALIGGGEVVR